MPAEVLMDSMGSAELTQWYGLWRLRNMEAEQERLKATAASRIRR